jgi:hypothetical protein
MAAYACPTCESEQVALIRRIDPPVSVAAQVVFDGVWYSARCERGHHFDVDVARQQRGRDGNSAEPGGMPRRWLPCRSRRHVVTIPNV